MKEHIYISGLYSGPSPSAGLGVARSLRQAFPAARLIGVDYWAGSSGLHADVFDKTWIKPSWDLIETSLYAKEIEAELAKGHAWISTLDLEVAWLAEALTPSRGLLVPTKAALKPTLKPRPAVADMLPFPLPPSLDISPSTPDEEIYEFARGHSFRVWLKGPYHEAVAVTTWRQLEAVRTAMQSRWQTERLSLQAHVRGYEESICIAAVGGELADAVYMKKRITTPEGKTWAGRISDVPADLLARVEQAVRALEWTGGAELELLRDVDGARWLMELNPRFPAWIHGATLAGRNLPAALVGKAFGVPFAAPTQALTPEFTRVVMEIPVRVDLPLPVPTEPDHCQLGAFGKYGAALSSVVPLLTVHEPSKPIGDAVTELADVPIAQVSEATRADLALLFEADAAAMETPKRLFLPRTATQAFRTARDLTLSTLDGCVVRPAYSIKTCPDKEYLELARSSGLLAECISMLEVKRAIETGWRPDEVILNGPGKWWPHTTPPVDGLRAVFCDSVEELERLVDSGRKDRLWGLRLKVPGFHSRFGIALDDVDSFEKVAALVARFPADREFGIHVHMASTLIGTGHWLDAVESAVGWAMMFEQATGRRVASFDLGGGFHPRDFGRLPFGDIAKYARERLPALTQMYVEPGRALTQSTMAVVTRVLDVRREDGEISEVVVDACIAELPLASAYPHRMLLLDDVKGLVPLARGKTRVLGRICMEDDVLAQGLALPNDLRIGDRFVICDAGAYERSMSYEFGRGGYAAT